MFPWQRVGRIWNNGRMASHLPSYGLRVIFVSDIVYTSCNFDCLRVNYIIQTPRIIIEHYGSRYNIALAFLVSFLPLSTA